MTEKSLYERLGGAFGAIAAVVDHFSDAIVQNPIVGQRSENPEPLGVAHEQSGQTSSLQIQAHVVGLHRGRRPPAVRSYGARQHASGLGRSASAEPKSPRRDSTRLRLNSGEHSTLKGARAGGG